MKSDVLFTAFSSEGKLDAMNRRVTKMINRSGFFETLKEGDRVAVKFHPGDRGNTTYLRPALVRTVIETLSQRGAKPFATETTTLYCRERFTEKELLGTAAWNGFCEETLSCPFLVADSRPDFPVEIEGEYLDQVGVAGEIARADALVVLTHVTCHGWTAGLAGSIKQLGMGCVGRDTKTMVHRSTTITLDPDLCDNCGKCAAICKSKGIEMGEESAMLTDDCVRCGVCIGSCPQGAIGYSHDFDHFAKALAEAAAGVLLCFKGKPVILVNFLVDLTWHCDCEDFSDLPVFQNLGAAVSPDPVAVDQASADLINESQVLPGTKADTPQIRSSSDKILDISGIRWWRQLEFAESMGLGSRSYHLTRVSA